MAPTVAYIALGSNLEDPRIQVGGGFDALAALPDTMLHARSRLFRTRPWGVVDQPDFVNAAACVRTRLEPRALLEALLAVETRAGRVRGVRNGPRVLDFVMFCFGESFILVSGLEVSIAR
ncbi:MAG: 2-amino-4-hydroxy-6-hydroxymethyldihydropteridine diphosphokinase, partial [Rhodanobacteraceae bacterium]